MEKLSRDIERLLVYNFTYPEIVNIFKTNKKLAKLANDNEIWTRLLKLEFNISQKVENPMETYKLHWIKINNLSKWFTDNMLLMNKRYANTELMQEDIFKIIQSGIKKTYSFKLDNFYSLSQDIYYVLTGGQYFCGRHWDGCECDQEKEKIRDKIDKLFKELGIDIEKISKEGERIENEIHKIYSKYSGEYEKYLGIEDNENQEDNDEEEEKEDDNHISFIEFLKLNATPEEYDLYQSFRKNRGAQTE